MDVSNGAENLIGETLAGKYRIEQLLGKGSMETVFRAVQIDLGRPVTLKVLHPELAAEGIIEQMALLWQSFIGTLP